jgi:uncharacterized protein YndB with AHSA1/START domain
MATAALTPDHDAVVAEIFVAAPPARVFKAITDPAQTAQWWGHTLDSPAKSNPPKTMARAGFAC